MDREGLAGNTPFKQGLKGNMVVRYVSNCKNSTKQTEVQVLSI